MEFSRISPVQRRHAGSRASLHPQQKGLLPSTGPVLVYDSLPLRICVGRPCVTITKPSQSLSLERTRPGDVPKHTLAQLSQTRSLPWGMQLKVPWEERWSEAPRGKPTPSAGTGGAWRREPGSGPHQGRRGLNWKPIPCRILWAPQALWLNMFNADFIRVYLCREKYTNLSAEPNGFPGGWPWNTPQLKRHNQASHLVCLCCNTDPGSSCGRQVRSFIYILSPSCSL